MKSELFSGTIEWDNMDSFLIPADTLTPRASVAKAGVIMESHAIHNGMNRLRNDPFTENTALVERHVSKSDGELLDWRCLLYPRLSPETTETLKTAIKENTKSPSESIAFYQTLYKRLPRLSVSKGQKVEICLPKNGIKIQGDPEKKSPLPNGHLTLPIPYPSEVFFQRSIQDMNRYKISTSLRLYDSLDTIDSELHGLIQGGLFTENAIRYYIDLKFKAEEI